MVWGAGSRHPRAFLPKPFLSVAGGSSSALHVRLADGAPLPQVETLGDGASETEWVTKRSSRLRALGDAKQWTHVARVRLLWAPL